MPALLDLFAIFLRLGCTSFGGPVAHIGYFRTEFVTQRRWFSEEDYAELVALCQFLPGPASSQVGFGIGLRRAGIGGALAAFIGFTLPSAALMFAVAMGATALSSLYGAALAQGLKLVAVAVVAHAVFGMARTLCTGPRTALIAVLALCLIGFGGAIWMQPLAIGIGAALGWCLIHDQTTPPAQPIRLKGVALPLLAVFAALLVGGPLLATDGLAAIFDAFYRTGALVFGGGHVVLPLLESETVARGWIDEDTFLTGYGAAQAIPGPLFTFATYLGALASPHGGILGAVVATVAIFLPGFLLLGAVLPAWASLRSRRDARAAIAGANAAVVGLLGAALYDPVFTSGIDGPADFAIAVAGFAALQSLKAPSWIVVIGVAAIGAFVGISGL